MTSETKAAESPLAKFGFPWPVRDPATLRGIGNVILAWLQRGGEGDVMVEYKSNWLLVLHAARFAPQHLPLLAAEADALLDSWEKKPGAGETDGGAVVARAHEL